MPGVTRAQEAATILYTLVSGEVGWPAGVGRDQAGIPMGFGPYRMEQIDLQTH